MKILGLSLLITVAVLQSNPYDFDPFHDHPDSTYALFAAAVPLPQTNPCWGSDQRCPDGKYRDRTGKEQPETCNNDYEAPDTGDAAHSCDCNRARICPEMPAGGSTPPPPVHESADCRVYCRGSHCHCKNPCESRNRMKMPAPESCPVGTHPAGNHV